MKTSLFSIFAIFISCLFLCTSCEKEPPKIGLLMHSYENERWVKDKAYIVDAIKEQGGEAMVEIANNDQGTQISQARQMIMAGVKVLIVVPILQDKAAEIVDMAHESGVKVIAYDRLISGCDLDYYVTTNSIRTGELQAEYIVSLKPKGNYALIVGSKDDNNSLKLFLGQMNVLQPLVENGSINIVYSEFTNDWSKEEAYRHANIVLDKYGDKLDAIITGSDAISNGVLPAIKEHNLAGKVLVAGQDAELNIVKEIIQGNQTCTVMKPLKAMAESTVKLAIQIADGKPKGFNFSSESNGKVLVPSILLEGIVVTKDNIESTVIASGFHSAADVY